MLILKCNEIPSTIISTGGWRFVCQQNTSPLTVTTELLLPYINCKTKPEKTLLLSSICTKSCCITESETISFVHNIWWGERNSFLCLWSCEWTSNFLGVLTNIQFNNSTTRSLHTLHAYRESGKIRTVFIHFILSLSSANGITTLSDVVTRCIVLNLWGPYNYGFIFHSYLISICPKTFILTWYRYIQYCILEHFCGSNSAA